MCTEMLKESQQEDSCNCLLLFFLWILVSEMCLNVFMLVKHTLLIQGYTPSSTHTCMFNFM